MTFTSSQMAQARYTTRGVTLDTFDNVTEDVCACVGAIVNAPADGLSIAEATVIERHARSIERASVKLRETISHLRARE